MPAAARSSLKAKQEKSQNIGRSGLEILIFDRRSLVQGSKVQGSRFKVLGSGFWVLGSAPPFAGSSNQI